MLERCLVLVKPSFSRNSFLCKDVEKEIKALNLKIVKKGYKKYNRGNAQCHYVDKINTDFYNELVEYIVSDVVYGFVVEGEDAISKTRNKVKELRVSLKDKFGLKTDIMRNILHCTSKVNVAGKDYDVNSKREINIFLNAQDGLL